MVIVNKYIYIVFCCKEERGDEIRKTRTSCRVRDLLLSRSLTFFINDSNKFAILYTSYRRRDSGRFECSSSQSALAVWSKTAAFATRRRIARSPQAELIDVVPPCRVEIKPLKPL